MIYSVPAKRARHRKFFSGTAFLLLACPALGFYLGRQPRAMAPTPTVPPAIEAYFSPHGGAQAAIAARIDQARQEAVAALYYFTDPALADALIRAHNRGVRVEVVLDKTQPSARGGQARRLISAGITVRFDRRHRIFHHKFLVVDRETLVTGSQNWTYSAENVNAENTLIIQSRELAARYRQVFTELMDMAKSR